LGQAVHQERNLLTLDPGSPSRRQSSTALFEGGSGFQPSASHPLTEDRLKRMSEADIPSSGPPLLTDEEWKALKAICSAKS